MKTLEIKTNDIDIYLGPDGAGYPILEIDIHNKHCVLSFKTIGDSENKRAFLFNAETLIKDCKSSIDKYKMNYYNKLEGDNKHQDYEYNTLKMLQDDFDVYSNIIISRITEFVDIEQPE